MHFKLELLAQTLQAIDNVLTLETLVGGVLPPLGSQEALLVDAQSLLAPFKAQQVPQT